jgi:hypothetical protein
MLLGNSAGFIVARSEAYGSTPESISYSVTAGQVYELLIYPFEDFDISSYTLSIAIDRPQPSGVAVVHRMFDTSTGYHFYTTNRAERDQQRLNVPSANYEGEAFYAPTTNIDTIAVHRFFNTQTRAHLYTGSEAERANIQQTLPHYRYEGVAFRAYSSDRGPQEELYRFLNTQTGVHIYTANETERANIVGTMPHMAYEGIAYWVL